MPLESNNFNETSSVTTPEICIAIKSVLGFGKTFTVKFLKDVWSMDDVLLLYVVVLSETVVTLSLVLFL